MSKWMNHHLIILSLSSNWQNYWRPTCYTAYTLAISKRSQCPGFLFCLTRMWAGYPQLLHLVSHVQRRDLHEDTAVYRTKAVLTSFHLSSWHLSHVIRTGMYKVHQWRKRNAVQKKSESWFPSRSCFFLGERLFKVHRYQPKPNINIKNRIERTDSPK